MKQLKVLIIDDEPGMCWVLEKTLKEEGYSVVKASNGAEGINQLTSDICMVLLDYKMPGISGLETLDQIMAKRPELAVIFMTGHSSMPVALEALKKGAKAYVTKPFHLNELKVMIKKALE
ncbi:MAG: histidine kinase [Peptococcaceae bacterium BICA1-7]|nr:MAG: histidine kinase [Peptococcaceae bacterium BICA1-7]HBV99164.1 response regulator [Desulfotomaculum sp.]